MNLLVIRHGRAGGAEEYAKTGDNDDLRPLTGDGQDRLCAAAADGSTLGD